MVSTVIKNWDNKTWLSSKNYIKSFNEFLIRNIKLNSNSKILDIGCGRGKILGNLSSNLKLKKKPNGIDIVDHKDRDKRIKFKKIDASLFFLKNRYKFDLILIKQTIHLFNFRQIKRLLDLSKKNLNKNELPAFNLMKKKLTKSLKRDKKIIKFISESYSMKNKKKFIYNVKISKKDYLKMINKRYISILLSLSEKEISKGIEEINSKYGNFLSFKDKLNCIVL